jgi:hypothetical protein
LFPHLRPKDGVSRPWRITFTIKFTPVSFTLFPQHRGCADLLDCAMHGSDTKVAFDLLDVSQTANGNGF